MFTARETEAPQGPGPGEWGPPMAGPGSQRAGEPRKRPERRWAQNKQQRTEPRRGPRSRGNSRRRGSQPLPGVSAARRPCWEPAPASGLGSGPRVPWSGVDREGAKRRAEPGGARAVPLPAPGHLGSDQEPGVQGEPEPAGGGHHPAVGATATTLPWGLPHHGGHRPAVGLAFRGAALPAAPAQRWEGRGCCPSRSFSRKGKTQGPASASLARSPLPPPRQLLP